MIIEYHKLFKKSFKKRISTNSTLVGHVKRCIDLFLKNPYDRLLKNHKLLGSKSRVRAFSVGGNLRIVYKEISKERVVFLDIGTHNQVY